MGLFASYFSARATLSRSRTSSESRPCSTRLTWLCIRSSAFTRLTRSRSAALLAATSERVTPRQPISRFLPPSPRRRVRLFSQCSIYMWTSRKRGNSVVQRIELRQGRPPPGASNTERGPNHNACCEAVMATDIIARPAIACSCAYAFPRDSGLAVPRRPRISGVRP